MGEVIEAEEIKLLGLTVQGNFKFGTSLPDSMSKFYYGNKIYNTSAESAGKIQKTMNVALIVMCHGDMRTHVSGMLQKTGWLNANNKGSMQRIMMMRKIMLTHCCRVTGSHIQQGSAYSHNTCDLSFNLTRGSQRPLWV